MTNDIESYKREIINVISVTAGLRLEVNKEYNEQVKIILLKCGLPQPEFIISRESAETLKQMLEEALKI